MECKNSQEPFLDKYLKENKEEVDKKPQLIKNTVAIETQQINEQIKKEENTMDAIEDIFRINRIFDNEVTYLKKCGRIVANFKNLLAIIKKVVAQNECYHFFKIK